jgi:protein-tyrosine kinase
MMEHNSRDARDASARVADLLSTSGHLTNDDGLDASTLTMDRETRFQAAAARVVDGAAAREPMSTRVAASPPGFGVADDLFVLKSPHSPRVADLRRVAQALAMRWFLGEPKRPALSIISADRREGRTAVATNLACIFAQSGVRTLLIDADLHNPAIHAKFGMAEPRAGTIYRPVQGVDNLAVIPATALLEHNSDRFMRSGLQTIIDSMRSEFEVIFVDTSAAATSNDYQIAALATAGALCVTRQDVTRARRSSRVLDLCEDAGIAIVGGVMLRP